MKKIMLYALNYLAEICRNTEIYNAKKENSINIAKNMFDEGIEDTDLISRITGIPVQEVLTLKD